MTPDISFTEAALGAAGLARKAGKCAVGTTQTVEKMRSGEGKLLLVASDVSDGTFKRLKDTAHTYGVPLARLDCTKTAVAARIGKTADTTSLLILDDGFLRILEKRGFPVEKDPERFQSMMEVQ